MQILDQLSVPRLRSSQPVATIELLQGDLAAIPREHAVDALVVSAFPESYTPNPGTLFADLYARGLDMRDVARNKEEDQRLHLGCWISRQLPPEVAEGFNFTRVVCFEPRYPSFLENTGFDSDNLEETVGFVFRCLNNFVIPETAEASAGRGFDISRIAMPLLATGNQGVPVELMLPRLLDAAIFWLEEGLPIERLKIVAFSPAETEVATSMFAKVASLRRSAPPGRRAQPIAAAASRWEARLAERIATEVIEASERELRRRMLAVADGGERVVVEALFERLDLPRAESGIGPATVPVARDDADPQYDVFVSYAHEQQEEVLDFVRELQLQYPELRIFYDRSSIPAGGLWIKLISDAVRNARTFIAVLSPDYSASPVCWDEFQCAKLKEYNTRTAVVRTVRLYSELELPPIMGISSFVDCAEGDLVKLRAAAATVLDGR